MDSQAPEGFKGVFSSQKAAKVGYGTTQRKIRQTLYIFAEEQSDGSFLIRPINKHFIPSGQSRTITRDELLSSYLPEPDMYMKKVAPALRDVRQSVSKADAHRAAGALISAEFEYQNALRVDEEHIRATFGLGLTYLDRGEQDSADIVFRRLITLDAAFEPEHKHLFNEFGIKMRKQGMYVQALRYYFKAFRLSRDDEHLLYNIARTYYERGKLRQAKKFLGIALERDPDFRVGLRLSRAIDKRLRSRKGIAAGPDAPLPWNVDV